MKKLLLLCALTLSCSSSAPQVEVEQFSSHTDPLYVNNYSRNGEVCLSTLPNQRAFYPEERDALGRGMNLLNAMFVNTGLSSRYVPLHFAYGSDCDNNSLWVYVDNTLNGETGGLWVNNWINKTVISINTDLLYNYNDGYPNSWMRYYDRLAVVAAHEFGHATGLKHISGPGVMNAYFSQASIRDLCASYGDAAELCRMWPPGQPPCNSAPALPCVTSTVPWSY